MAKPGSEEPRVSDLKLTVHFTLPLTASTTHQWSDSLSQTLPRIGFIIDSFQNIQRARQIRQQGAVLIENAVQKQKGSSCTQSWLEACHAAGGSDGAGWIFQTGT